LNVFFIDTSALVKRYLPEPGSAWIIELVTNRRDNAIVISELTTVETISALARLERQAELTTDRVDALSSLFLLHVEEQYLVVPLQGVLTEQARRLVRTHKLRTLDAIQLASAISASTSMPERMTFVSGDNDLLAAAVAEGFSTDNPYNHP
jgi:hypothetical protein